MRYRYEYQTDEERASIINNNSQLFLIEEQNIIDGNFLIFSDEPLEKEIVYMNLPEKEFEGLKSDSKLLKSQNKATSERADFIEDIIAEMAMQVYK